MTLLMGQGVGDRALTIGSNEMEATGDLAKSSISSKVAVKG